jgi:zinc D-Ala-D-Ala carboxypeptidase
MPDVLGSHGRDRGSMANAPRSRTALRTLTVMSVVVGLLAIAVITLALLSGTSGGASANGAPSAPRLTADERSALGEPDGYIPSGSVIKVTDEVPAITNLDPSLRTALQRAAADASATADVDLLVTSGWRSDRYQQALLDDAISEHGTSGARALVQTPAESRHTKGQAVDIGFTDADDWLNRNGAAYGLCQVYANEIWHFELLTTPGGECPAMRGDASAG